tara:strand:- start:1345 stop:1959 length:615 start_codon:yes stop_codon:yes gene_type:complete
MNIIDIFISFMLGVLIKLYDEITDNNITIKKSNINIIKLSTVILYTYIGLKYPLIIIYTFFLFIASYICTSKIFKSTSSNGKELKEMDDPYWTQLFNYTLLLIIIILVKNKNKILDIRINNKIINFIILIIQTIILIVVEFYFVTEEYSNQKMAIRKMFVICCLLLLIFAYNFRHLFYYEVVLFANMWFLGYFITWIIVKQNIS